MRPNAETLRDKLSKHIGKEEYFIVTSLKFVGDSNYWVARISGYNKANHTAHYRIVEGEENHVHNITGPMLSRPSSVSAWTGCSNDSETSLDWLFEERHI